MLARAENRGLGIQTWEIARHLKPDKVLVVDLGELRRGYEMHLDRYPGARVALADPPGHLPDDAIDWLLSDVDVLYTAESAYDYRIFDIARERGVRTCLQGNYEFLIWGVEPTLPKPDLFLAPSTWHLDRWPTPTVYLPTPVATDRLRWKLRDKVNRVVHVAGHRAMQDRNGTRLAMRMMRYVGSDVKMIVRSQQRLARPVVGGENRIDIRTDDIPNYWDLYEGGDALVFPRRFGGQCLPISEALALGMPVVSLNVEPQRRFLHPDLLVRPRKGRTIRVQSGDVAWYDADPKAIARVVDALATSETLATEASELARDWTLEHSWEAMLPQWKHVLQSLADGEVAVAS